METATVLCIIEHLSTGGEEMLVTELMPSLGKSGFKSMNGIVEMLIRC